MTAPTAPSAPTTASTQAVTDAAAPFPRPASSAVSSNLFRLLYGRAPLPRIVAVEPAGQDAVQVFRRDNDGTLTMEPDTFSPWLLIGEADRHALQGERHKVSALEGPGALNRLVEFPAWAGFNRALSALRAAELPHFALTSYVAQYLTAAGRTLFHDMRFEELHRLQLDIETTSLQPDAPNAAVLLVALTDNRGYEEVITAEFGEAELLRRLTQRIVALDPDVIEGHNLLDFDLTYLLTRAQALGIPLEWGRGGQPIRLQERQGRLKVGARLLPSVRIHIYGRHILDTYQQVQRFDAEGKLESYGLKPVMESLHLVRPDRVFVDRTEISELWRDDPQRLAQYCLDDARDVRTLSELITPTDFYQSQIIPRSYQDVATGGTGEKINALLVRAYHAEAQAVPLPQPARDYPGGYLELRQSGVFRHVVKCDVESLYPSVMLSYGVQPRSDTQHVFLPLLGDLTHRRLEAKRHIKTTQGPEQAYWNGLSASYKVLINSFYGYLGYARANFNDFDAAEFVTTTGQDLIKKVLTALEERGCQIIEVDTDGVYFVAPAGVQDEAAETALIEAVGQVLPEGIRLAHDGRYVGMVSLKQKTYFLLTYDGKLIAKGSSLRSRRDERYLRDFVQRAAVTLIEQSLEAVSEQYLDLARQVQRGELPVEEYARNESITNKTFHSPGLKRLAAAARGMAVGQKVAVYQRNDGSLALTAEYASDEDRDYLLRRLHDMARRFEAVCPDRDTFDHLFPKFTASSDPTQAPVQLSLF